MGPLSLLAMLETQLGLVRDFPSRAERIVQFRECLKVCDTPSCFYHATFAADELGTAAKLLDWRDSWRLHGWTGGFPDGAGRRLMEMAAVEERTAESLAPSIGKRLKYVADALVLRGPAIGSISLVDPLDAFPRRWRDVLAQLPVEQAALSVSGNKGSLLGELQAGLHQAHSGAQVDKIPWRDDGSVRIVRAETRLTAARWLADEICRPTGETVLVAEIEGALLDTVLDATDRARHGFEENSVFRPALQALPLALQTLWEPLDFYALLKFLTHPIAPIPGYARRLLAAELAEQPGIGGTSWDAVLERIVAHYGQKGPSVREAIRFWIEHPRYEPGSGAPIAVVVERVQRLAEYFAGRLGGGNDPDATHFAAAYAQATAVGVNLDALARQGETTLRPRALQTLILQATGRGAANPLTEAEVECFPAVTNPASVIEPFDRAIWWQLGAPSMPQRYPWSRREMRELAEVGVELPPFDKVLERTAAEWLRPVLAARNELVLVLPPKGEEVHPLWLMVEALLEGVPVEPVERVLFDAKASDSLMEVALKPLPQRKRWWQLPQDVAVAPRKRESYSSLEIFFNNPYQWVLQYPAWLRPSSILAVSSDFLLFGNLAHRLIERFFRTASALAMSNAAIERWFEDAFPQIVREEGAVLLMRGRRADLVKLRVGLKRALLELQGQLVRSGVSTVDPEKELTGQFIGGELAGMADLVVAKARGERAILDVKWSGGKKYSEKLGDTRHLQLAVYGELLRQSTGVWPQVAYFILDQARLMAADANFFSGARVVQSKAGESAADLWQRFVESWKWRRAQLDTGRIEVVLDGIEETEDSIAPENGLAVEPLNPRYNDYLVLAGVEVP